MSLPDRHEHRIEALLFDVEGVIAHPDNAMLDLRLKAFAQGLDSGRLYAARNTPLTYALWEEYSCGRLSRTAYWGPILEELGLEPSAEAIRLIRAAQRDAWWATLSAPILEIARSAKGRARTGILSNSAPEHEAHIPRFAGGFDIACFSHRMGLRKPDRDAYMEAVRRLECEPPAIVFIDDKLRNVDAARAFGMQAIHFTDPKTLADELAATGFEVGVPAGETEAAG